MLPKDFVFTEEMRRKIRESKLKRKLELGYINSPETRRKIGEWRKGKPLSKETKEKLSRILTGRKMPPKTEETLKRMSKAQKGKKASGVTRHKMSESRKGAKNPKWLGGLPKCIKCQKLLSRRGFTKCQSCAGKGRFISKETRIKLSEANKGEKGSNWKGGITDEHHKIRRGIEMILWRDSVFARDNYTDAKTGIRGGKLVAHHILNFAQYPELRTSIENGITLSQESHREFHRRYGIKNNTREQLEEFLKS